MKFTHRILSFLLAAVLTVGVAASAVVAEPAENADSAPESSAAGVAESASSTDAATDTATSTFSRFSYHEYSAIYSDAQRATAKVTIDASSYTSANEGVMVYDGVDTFLTDSSRVGKSILTSESSYVEWTVEIPQTGLYVMNLDYYTVNIAGQAEFESKGSDIERSILIDGEQPFTEAAGVALQRKFVDREEIQQDIYGHDIRPESEEVNCWLNSDCHDASGVFGGPFEFYLTAGTHRIAFKAVKEPVVLNRITLYTPDTLPTFAEAMADYEQKGYKKVTGVDPQRVQAENPSSKSSSTLYASYDRGSAAMEPASFDVIKLNQISSSQFSSAYQWVEWTVNVPEAGLYKISTRFQQTTRDGSFCNRVVYINGKIPYEEAKFVRFNYDSAWQVENFKTTSGEDMWFYLDKGDNTIRLEVSLGEFADAASRVEELVYDLNQCYREIVQITGTVPDAFRDYKFRTLIPGTIEVLASSLTELRQLKEDIEAFTGQNGSLLSTFDTLINDLDSMANKPTTIAKKLEGFKTNLGSLSTWQLNITSQPISFDWIEVMPADAELPKANAGFFKSFGFQFRMFLASFYMDYNNVGITKRNSSEDDDEDKKEVTVWVATGRDQFAIIRRLINNNQSETLDGVNVNLQLVAAGTLLPSVLAGTGPDVSLQSANTDPLNYAIRNAVIDLTQFDTYDEVSKRFNKEALVPYTYKGKVYALPETFTFNMMFYRSDVLAEYGLSVPQTWQDVYNCMVKLSMNGMFFGVMPTVQTYASLLYQNGGAFYNEDGSASALDTPTAIRAFEQWTGFYTEYSSTVDFDFANRFRTGEMPIGIGDYTLYNQMSVFATEIKGLWEFTSIPGVEKTDENGNTYIDRSSATTGSACILLKTAKDYESAWKFMDWWTSTDAQVSYGREIESLQGVAGRYATANEEALSMLAWDVEDYKALKAQWAWAKAVPEYPGSYILSRYVDFAFRNVLNKSVEPGQELLEYVDQINDELTRKRAEFEKDK